MSKNDMEDWEKGKFEKEWQDVFQNAELEDNSEAAWKNIDLQLSHAEGMTMKKRVVFYQRLAAASILFALVSAGVAIYIGNFFETTSSSLSQRRIQNNSTPDVTNSITPLAQAEQKEDYISPTDQKQSDAGKNAVPLDVRVVLTTANDDAAVDRPLFTASEGSNYRNIIDQRMLSYAPLAIEASDVNVEGNYREVTLYRQLPAFPASYMANSSSKKSNQEQIWASVGAAAGSFSPNLSAKQADFSTGVPIGMDAASRSGFSKSSDVGSAYTFGLSMGTKFAKRWVMQGGINYLNQNLGYQSNLQQLDASNQYSTALAGRTSGQAVKLTAPYQVSSINEIVSVPLQAGYLVVDRRFGFQLNTGVATDLFLRNNLVDESGQLKRSTESAGSSSPYRTISWAGLLNTEVSYRIADRYRVSVVPGLRYSLNSVFKSESGSVSNPLITDVGFRFRYIFR